MPLSDERYERFEEIMQALEPELKSISGNSNAFVKDQLERWRRWGQNINLSLKQWAWLEDLYEKHAALPSLTRDDHDAKDDEPGFDDPDDEIPF